MSGGSYEYFHYRIEEVAKEIAMRHSRSAPHRAFAALLMKVAKAMHDVEWVDSGDMGPGDDLEAIQACLSNTDELQAAVEQAKEAMISLEKALARLDG